MKRTLTILSLVILPLKVMTAPQAGFHPQTSWVRAQMLSHPRTGPTVPESNRGRSWSGSKDEEEDEDEGEAWPFATPLACFDIFAGVSRRDKATSSCAVGLTVSTVTRWVGVGAQRWRRCEDGLDVVVVVARRERGGRERGKLSVDGHLGKPPRNYFGWASLPLLTDPRSPDPPLLRSLCLPPPSRPDSSATSSQGSARLRRRPLSWPGSGLPPARASEVMGTVVDSSARANLTSERQPVEVQPKENAPCKEFAGLRLRKPPQHSTCIHDPLHRHSHRAVCHPLSTEGMDEWTASSPTREQRSTPDLIPPNGHESRRACLRRGSGPLGSLPPDRRATWLHEASAGHTVMPGLQRPVVTMARRIQSQARVGADGRATERPLKLRRGPFEQTAPSPTRPVPACPFPPPVLGPSSVPLCACLSFLPIVVPTSSFLSFRRYKDTEARSPRVFLLQSFLFSSTAPCTPLSFKALAPAPLSHRLSPASSVYHASFAHPTRPGGAVHLVTRAVCARARLHQALVGRRGFPPARAEDGAPEHLLPGRVGQHRLGRQPLHLRPVHHLRRLQHPSHDRHGSQRDLLQYGRAKCRSDYARQGWRQDQPCRVG